jgi:hypothetical protein
MRRTYPTYVIIGIISAFIIICGLVYKLHEMRIMLTAVLSLGKPERPKHIKHVVNPIICKPADINTSFVRLGHISNEVKYYPVYGKPIDRRQNRWYYYTVINKSKHAPIIVPLFYDNRDCMSDWGCKQLYNDDIVSILGSNDSFKVKLYNTFAY